MKRKITFFPHILDVIPCSPFFCSLTLAIPLSWHKMEQSKLKHQKKTYYIINKILCGNWGRKLIIEYNWGFDCILIYFKFAAILFAFLNYMSHLLTVSYYHPINFPLSLKIKSFHDWFTLGAMTSKYRDETYERVFFLAF